MKKVYEEISDEELKSLTTAVKARYGIDFTNYELKSLKRGFGRLISRNGYTSLLQLWGKILGDREFFMGCIDELTVNLTEMFRNQDIWEFIRDEVKTTYAKQEKLRVWHAGCSTGEEVYTMLYIIQSISFFYKAEIKATDLSLTALNKAMEGSYSPLLYTKYKRNFERSFPGESLDNLISETDDGGFKIKERYKKAIKFDRHNLVCDEFPEEMDIIFCRNVMIYFDDKLKLEVLKKFHQALKPGGFFVIGFYDMMPEDAKELFHIYDSKTKVYKKI